MDDEESNEIKLLCNETGENEDGKKNQKANGKGKLGKGATNEEDIIDSFLIISYATLEDLEVCKCNSSWYPPPPPKQRVFEKFSSSWKLTI